MGFPHHPNPRETTVLSKYFGDAEARTLDGWKKRGGYKALEKALGMPPADIVNVVKESGLRGRGGGGFPPPLLWAFIENRGGQTHYLFFQHPEANGGTLKKHPLRSWTTHVLFAGCA